jgi:hypothetical protein
MKTLLAVGCSYTDQNFLSLELPEVDCSFPKWPEVLGNMLEYDNVVNLGKSGNNNDSIQNQAQDYIMENDVDMLCVLWSEPMRINIHDSYSALWYNDSSWNANKKERQATREAASLANFPEKLINNWQKKSINPEIIAKIMLHNDINHLNIGTQFVRNIYNLDQIAKNKNIPIYHMQGASLWKKHVYQSWSQYIGRGLELDSSYNLLKFKTFLNAFIDSPYFKILDKQTNIYGWPFYSEIGGTTIAAEIYKNLKFTIGELDGHPNAEGHQKIASQFMEIIK